MQTSLLPRRKSARRVSFWPDMAPLAGIMLLLALIYAVEDFHNEWPDVSLPSSTPICCSDPDPDRPSVTITITKAGRLFLTGSRRVVSTAVQQQSISLSQVVDSVRIAQSRPPYQLYCYLRADQDLPCSDLKLVLDKIGELNIRHFHLITDSKPIDTQTASLLY